MAQLCQHKERLEELDVEVLVISFGEVNEAKAWQQENCPAFQLLLDPDRRSYRTYGLARSIFRSWSIRTFWYYTQALLSGRKWHGIKGDPMQLGGDFIINTDGRFLLTYRSKETTDRPAVEELLALLGHES